MECLFCKMVRGELVTDKVYEDGETLAFLDANPSAPGHTLVVPKEHKETLLDMNDGEVSALFRTVKKVTGMIQKNLKPEGFNIGINHGNIAGARVPHLQVHIIPRFKDDKGGMIQMIVSNKPKEDNPSIARKISEGEDIPDYIKRQIKGYQEEEKKEVKKTEEPEEEKESEEEKELEEREKELFPEQKEEVNTRKFEKKIEEKEEKEEEDIYEKMLKRMRIPN
ncbi:MAG: HIT family protein [archaeon]|nr:MAG: HIT family protein [archaeon]